ncbi:hypothetical protein RchiOBHm_Chr2g0137161 [Rosa chinensis]|uniref:Uncharacterized protein n=1 Tax=Rosa chinensis TaxID=74649 RepID=A0A2P6RWJ5_ROSCH|nr:hypothetical protein RchiOBHm_Chr2g0137161 [Rosa chinensis]
MQTCSYAIGTETELCGLGGVELLKWLKLGFCSLGYVMKLELFFSGMVFSFVLLAVKLMPIEMQSQCIVVKMIGL